jgi:hypothetical protein
MPIIVAVRVIPMLARQGQCPIAAAAHSIGVGG